MKKIVLTLCVIFMVSALTADTKVKTIADFQSMSIKEQVDFLLEMVQSTRDLRDLYMLESLYLLWENEAWVNEEKIIITYEAGGYMVEMLWMVWEEEEWVNSYRQIYTNNGEGYPIELLYQIWIPDSRTWMDAAMMFYTYDANWNMTEMLIQMWFIDQWMNASRYTMEYNGDNNPTSVLNQEWDFENETGWLNSGLETYTYDGLFLEEILDQNWENDSEWIINHKLTFTEAGNAYPATEIRENWDQVNWTYDWYHQFFYNGDWNMTQQIEQDWDNDQWVNWEDHYYTYEDGYQTERLTYRWEDERNWVTYRKITNTYGTLDAEDHSISPNNEFVLSNYPNPFSNRTTISFNLSRQDAENTRIGIYNIRGQKIMLRSNGFGNLKVLQWKKWELIYQKNQKLTFGLQKRNNIDFI